MQGVDTLKKGFGTRRGSFPSNRTLPISSLVNPPKSETPHDPISQAEQHVETALNDLEATGVLCRSNQMNLAELLNPIAEAHDMFDATDQDIYEAVMDAKKVQEESLGSESSSETSESIEDVPTHPEALRAVWVLQNYTKMISNPFARKLEMMLGAFGRETRILGTQRMKGTKITNYFLRKQDL